MGEEIMNRFDRALVRTCLSTVLTVFVFFIVAACEPETILVVNQTSLSVNDAGGAATLSFTANKAWTATSDQSWCRVSPAGGDASANNNVLVSVACEANTTYDPRSCKITIQCAELTATVSVVQSQSNGLFVSTSEYDLSNEAHRLNVEVKANIDFEVISNVDWIQYVETKALKTSTIVLDVAANADYDLRTGTVVVRQKGGGLEGILTIRQNQNYGLFVSPTEIMVGNQATVAEFKVEQNVAYDVVIPDDVKSWISVVGTRSLQTETISLSIAGNPAYFGREAFVVVEQRDGALRAAVKVVQAQADYWSMEPAQDSVGYAGGNVQFSVITNMDYRLSVPDFATWITTGETREESFGDGLTKYTHTLNIAPNELTYSRSAAISFVVGSQIVSQFVVYQEPDAIIEFEDNEVKRVCVEHWDLNKDGELSCTEAAAVTDVTSFMNAFSAKSYKTFNEFRFFTGISYIPDNMFKDWFVLESITLPNNIRGIGGSSFMGCTKLKKIDIPESVNHIGYMAFRNCSRLVSIHIPKSVETIGHYSFWGCPGLNHLEIDDLEQWLQLDLSEGSHPFCSLMGEDRGELYVSGISATILEIPSGCSYINDFAFIRCGNIRSIIMNDNISIIGRYAFMECSSLSSIIMPKNLLWINEYAFCYCYNLTDVSFNDNLLKIDDYAFSCNALRELLIPKAVEEIGDEAFAGCGNLVSVSIPNSVINLGAGVFRGCKSLSSVSLPKGLEEIPFGLFDGCSKLSSIHIPETVTTIGDSAFRQSGLTSISIPSGVKEIGWYVFADCGNLDSIYFNEGLKSVGAGAFVGCLSLNIVELPSTIEMIGGCAFRSCNSLTRIVIKAPTPPDCQGDNVEVGGGMFEYTGDCPIFVPAGSVEAYKTARYWSDYAHRIRAIE